MSDLILVLLVVVLLVCLVGTLVGFLVYSGLLSDVIIKTGPPPIKNVTFAYKFKEGSYKDCGAAYTETCSIGPKLSTISVFYDDPKQRPAEKCRYVVGSVLCEGEEQPDKELQELYQKFGFKVFSVPEVSHAVTTSFPCTTPLSNVLGPYRVYPRLSSYIELIIGAGSRRWLLIWQPGAGTPVCSSQERKLSAFPTIEICGSDVINYMVPLSRQTDFFVPEMKEDVKTDVKEEDSDEDRGTDITGADSHSDVSSVSGGVPWDSRETSLAASTAASLASSLPLRDVMDANEDIKHRDQGDRCSNESMGSGSSFEELDMDQEEQEEAAVKEEKEHGEEEEEVPEGEDGAREELVVEKKDHLGDGAE
uniref:Testis expressed 264, ER-phagy receptor a n=1 Tax=Labrus bergylta TaxID=56723 RepID=A0A3Q3F714_9LABR